MIVVRLAALADAESIATIHVRSWQKAYRGIVPDDFLQALSIERRTETWQAVLLKQTSDVWVAEENGRLLGWISVGKSRDADADAATAELWAVYVDPGKFRRGVGRALWLQAEGHLRSMMFSAVTLWVLQANQSALTFYERMGFLREPGSEKTIEIGGSQLIETRLRRRLGD
jgi:ribosomal protein S18 acetylase RimI-like enzyme